MCSIVDSVGVLLLVLSGLCLMLDFRSQAWWLARAAFLLVLGTAILDRLGGELRLAMSRAELPIGSLCAALALGGLALGGLALVGFVLWTRRTNGNRGDVQLSARRRALPPPPPLEEET